MPLIRERSREDAEIPSSSLADIAFLLLIFFLLVTTIDIDTGIGLVLPPPAPPNEQPPKIKKRNLLNILVNAKGVVQVDGEPTPINNIRQKVIKFVDNHGQNPNLSDSPDKAVVSIKTARKTQYKTYVSTLDQVKGGYLELRNRASQQNFGKDYDELAEKSPQQKKIKDMYPEQISIAEPDKGS